MMMIVAVNIIGVAQVMNIVEKDANQIMVNVKKKEEIKEMKEMMILSQAKVR